MEEGERWRETYRKDVNPKTRSNDRRSLRKHGLVGMDDGTRARSRPAGMLDVAASC